MTSVRVYCRVLESSALRRTIEILLSDPTRPDLVVRDFDVADTSLSAGEAVDVSAVVENQGDASAGESPQLVYLWSDDSTISMSDQQLSTDTVVVLKAGQSSTEQEELTAPLAPDPFSAWRLCRGSRYREQHGQQLL